MITVIIPTYNNEDLIERSIFSVLYQTMTDWELIVVDDGSTDKTPEILKRYIENEKIRVITNPENVGVGISRKIAIDVAKGEFITFLDSDDILNPDFLKLSLELQQQHDSDVVYTSYTILFPDGRTQIVPAGDYIMEHAATPQLHFVQDKKFLTGKLFRKSLLEKIPWSPKRVAEDVQTLFFATYEAEKVRSSSYSGYVHCFREGSLLANAAMEICYCGSIQAEIEMYEYLQDKNDPEMVEFILRDIIRDYTMFNTELYYGNGGVTWEGLTKHKLDKQYDEITDWVEKHKKIIESCRKQR